MEVECGVVKKSCAWVLALAYLHDIVRMYTTTS